MPKIIPIRDLKDTAAVCKMCAESSEPIYVTKNGYGELVIMNMKVYEKKLLLADAYEKVAAAEEQIRTGKFHDALEAHSELRKKYGI